MNILEKIVQHKHKEVAEKKALTPIQKLERSIYNASPIVSMKAYLRRQDKVGIIAEVKRGSPSEGLINEDIDVERLSISYMQSGASALSILTDETFFSGHLRDLMTARKYNYCPILRKDFIIDEYQVHESRSIGADCILLIAACLTPEKCRTLARLAKSLSLETLLEIRDREELDVYLNEDIDIVGVNNRDLKTFETSIQTSLDLAEAIPQNITKISESGIRTASDLVQLRAAGFNGYLIGTTFMQKPDPAHACKTLISEYKTLRNESKGLRTELS